MKERNYTMGQQKKPTQIEKNHTMVNRKKREGEKPYNGQQKKTRRRKTIQWSTEKNTKERNHKMVNRKKHEGEKPYNGQQKKNSKEINHTMVNRKKTRRRETIQW